MKTILKSALGIVFVLAMLVSIMAIHTFAAELPNIVDIDISKCSKVYFKCETDKDPTQYAVGEEMIFTLTIYADSSVLGDKTKISAPYIGYTIKGEDGFYTTGCEDAASGSIVLKAKMSEPGTVRLTADIRDANKEQITGSNIGWFEGGAIAGASELKTTYAEPLDFDEFWERKLAELDECAPDLISIEQVTSTNLLFDRYIVYVDCIGRPELVATKQTYTTGYLTVPKNASAGSLGLRLQFHGYGVGDTPTSYNTGCVTFSISAHSIEQGRESSYYSKENLGLKEYGFNAEQNADPDTAYLTYMLLRDVQGSRFLKKYFGNEGGVSPSSSVNTSAWKGLWNGKDIASRGSSQGGFQAIGVAALDSDISRVDPDIPWFSDVAGNTVPTRIQSTFRPEYAPGLRYLDTALLAKRIKASVVKITAGTGDGLCPMHGVQAIYNNLNMDYVDEASITFAQGGTHGSNKTWQMSYTQSKTKDSVNIPTDVFVGIDFGREAFKEAWFNLTGRKAEFEGSSTNGYNVNVSIVDFADANNVSVNVPGADIIAVGFTGDLTELNNTHKSVLKYASLSSSNVYLVAFGEDYENENALARTIALNLSGAIFDDQPKSGTEYSLVSDIGFVSSTLVLAKDIENVDVYPVTNPCYALKTAGPSIVYKSPDETGTENGSITLIVNGVSKNFEVCDASNVELFGEDAGVSWFIKDGTLNIYGKDFVADSNYDWNLHMDGIVKINIGDGITSIPADAFNVPQGAEVIIPNSAENIDDNAFRGAVNFTIVSYEDATAYEFAIAQGIQPKSLGVRYVSGNLIGGWYPSPNNFQETVNNLWTLDRKTGVLTITSNKTDWNETGSCGTDMTGSWKEYLQEIREVVLVGNISKISNNAFSGATNLEKVTMTAISEMGSSAFNNCINLTTVVVRGHVEIPGVLDFSTVVGGGNGSSSFAQKYANFFGTANNKAVGIILNDSYSSDKTIKTENLPKNIKKIYGSTAYLEVFCLSNEGLKFVPFGRTSGDLISWSIEDGVMNVIGMGTINSLGDDISSYAKDVKEVVISASVTGIGDGAFEKLTKLKKATFLGDAPKVTNDSKPFGLKEESFYVSVGREALGFDEKTWCGYTVFKGAYIAGDTNNDGEVSIEDAILLAQHLANWPVEINILSADCNGDGIVDIRDAVRLVQYLADWDVELVGSSVPSIPDVPDESEDNEIVEDDFFDN